MFQAATLVCERVDGSDELVVIGNKSMNPLITLREQIRKSGEYNGIPVRSGFIQASWNMYPDMHFQCQPVAVAEPIKRGRKAGG